MDALLSWLFSPLIISTAAFIGLAYYFAQVKKRASIRRIGPRIVHMGAATDITNLVSLLANGSSWTVEQSSTDQFRGSLVVSGIVQAEIIGDLAADRRTLTLVGCSTTQHDVDLLIGQEINRMEKRAVSA